MSPACKIVWAQDVAATKVVCDAILGGLPDWFGPYDIYKDYLDYLETRPSFVAQIEAGEVGILTLSQTSAAAVDIHLMAVTPDQHGKGIGQALVDQAVLFAREKGAKFLTVKTLGPSHPHKGYARTRRFYERQGFAPIEEFIDFWGEGYPMQLYCRNVV